ncbi:hypothetical protein [Actinoplanes sp. DH11]|uniref:hypothetical protein n=1 Tax=Actinoplanes sp. DH11 TaxID=2857011 RepID=UPI001E4B5316|nr:hypothetical protein [Actinoplanes sp. DH11]
MYWTDTSLAETDQTTVDVGGVRFTGGAAVLARELDRPPSDEVISWRGRLQGISVLLALTTLLVVAGGPAPVRGTRWYWFWVTLFVPYGLGLILWLFRDRPWVRAAEQGERDSGWFGAVTAVLANFMIPIVVFGLSRLLGDRWIPG